LISWLYIFDISQYFKVEFIFSEFDRDHGAKF